MTDEQFNAALEIATRFVVALEKIAAKLERAVPDVGTLKLDERPGEFGLDVEE